MALEGISVCDTVGEPTQVYVSVSEGALPLPLTQDVLIKAQKSNPSLRKCWTAVVEKTDCDEKQPLFVVCDWEVVYQVVIPVDCRQHALQLSHEHLWSGHLGVTKTYNRVLKHISGQKQYLPDSGQAQPTRAPHSSAACPGCWGAI